MVLEIKEYKVVPLIIFKQCVISNLILNNRNTASQQVRQVKTNHCRLTSHRMVDHSYDQLQYHHPLQYHGLMSPVQHQTISQAGKHRQILKLQFDNVIAYVWSI